jgi:hypothetical protein
MASGINPHQQLINRATKLVVLTLASLLELEWLEKQA